MERDQIFAKVVDVVVEELNVDEMDVVESASLLDDLGADELDQTELVMALEEQFDIAIPDEDAENFKTVGDILEFLEDAL